MYILSMFHSSTLSLMLSASSDVVDSEHSIILDQVENGVAIRMAVIFLLAQKINK